MILGYPYDNPRGNAGTEKMMRTIKEGAIWIGEFTSLEGAKEVIGRWQKKIIISFYPHSKLGYKFPVEFEKQNTMNFTRVFCMAFIFLKSYRSHYILLLPYIIKSLTGLRGPATNFSQVIRSLTKDSLWMNCSVFKTVLPKTGEREAQRLIAERGIKNIPTMGWQCPNNSRY